MDAPVAAAWPTAGHRRGVHGAGRARIGTGGRRRDRRLAPERLCQRRRAAAGRLRRRRQRRVLHGRPDAERRRDQRRGPSGRRQRLHGLRPRRGEDPHPGVGAGGHGQRQRGHSVAADDGVQSDRSGHGRGSARRQRGPGVREWDRRSDSDLRAQRADGAEQRAPVPLGFGASRQQLPRDGVPPARAASPGRRAGAWPRQRRVRQPRRGHPVVCLPGGDRERDQQHDQRGQPGRARVQQHRRCHPHQQRRGDGRAVEPRLAGLAGERRGDLALQPHELARAGRAERGPD